MTNYLVHDFLVLKDL